MAYVAPHPAPTTAPLTRTGTGRLRLTHPTRGYAVTRNPFAIWSILPLVVLCFVGLALAEFFGDHQVFIDPLASLLQNHNSIDVTLVVFLIATLGLLAIPAMTLKGSLNLTHDGVTFEHGKNHVTAGWEQVAGLRWRFDSGLCLILEGAQQSKSRIRLPGGFNATDGTVRIPLRMFGDRQFSILYDLRDRLPEATWLPALKKVRERGPRMNLAIYAGTVLFGAGAIVAVALNISNRI